MAIRESETGEQSQRADLSVDLCGLTLRTPLVGLSGCVGFGEEYTRVEGFTNRELGALCLKYPEPW